jgi:hypothetical protein
MSKRLKLALSREEHDLIAQIVNRAEKMNLLGNRNDDNYAHVLVIATETLSMSLTAAHCNGCPIDFARLLDADDFNFTHDVVGIDRNCCRKTGQLLNFFLPRFAK